MNTVSIDPFILTTLHLMCIIISYNFANLESSPNEILIIYDQMSCHLPNEIHFLIKNFKEATSPYAGDK